MESTQTQALPNSQILAFLPTVDGPWQGTARVWFSAPEPVDESPVEMQLRSKLDGCLLIMEYKGSFQGKPLEGMMMWTWTKKGECSLAWVDSFHTGSHIMHFTGKLTETGFDVHGTYAAGSETWGWRTLLEPAENGALEMKAFNIKPDGIEFPATHVLLKRTHA